MKEIKLKADKPFHNNVDVAVIDFPDGPEGEELKRSLVGGMDRGRQAVITISVAAHNVSGKILPGSGG